MGKISKKLSKQLFMPDVFLKQVHTHISDPCFDDFACGCVISPHC